MLISKVCERAVESIIDELAVCALSEKYPDHLDLIVDALFNLTEFDWLDSQLKNNNPVPKDRKAGGRLVFVLLCATITTLDYGDKAQTEKFAKMIIRMCEVNERFKQGFIDAIEESDDGPESYRCEVGDMAVYACQLVMKAIK